MIANGRSAAGGVTVAPLADPEDGKLDVILVPNSDVLDLSIVTARLLEGDYTVDERVHHHRAARVEFTADPPMTVSIDGELVTGKRFAFTTIPKAVRVYTGRDYHHRGRRAGDPQTGVVKTLAKRVFGLIGAGLFLVTRMPGGYLAGLLVTLACLFGFLSIARGVSGDYWNDTNRAAAELTGRLESPAADAIAGGLHWAGHYLATTFIGVGLAVYWLRKRFYLEAAMLIAVVVGCGVLELVLKGYYQVARPTGDGWFPRPDSYSFPSGHALRSVGLFGYLAALSLSIRPRRPRWWLAAGLLIVLGLAIAASRVYLGVHTFMDVLAGTFAAVCWAACCLAIRHYAIRRRRRTRPVTSVGSTSPGE